MEPTQLIQQAEDSFQHVLDNNLGIEVDVVALYLQLAIAKLLLQLVPEAQSETSS